MGAPAGLGPGDDVGPTVPVHVPGATRHPAREGGRVREEAREDGPVGAAEHLHVGAAARARSRDDVCVAVPVDVTRGYHASREGGVREEVC